MRRRSTAGLTLRRDNVDLKRIRRRRDLGAFLLVATPNPYLGKSPDGYCGIGGCGGPFKSAELQAVVECTPRVPAGSHTVSGVLRQDPACFCGELRAGSGDDVYRNSTGVLRSGKSAAKQ